MELSPDSIVYWRYGIVTVNATLVYTWVAMALLVGGSHLITRRLVTSAHPSPRQSVLETLLTMIRQQIEEITAQEPARFLPFIGTLFLFIATMNLLSIVPGYKAPTGSLSTTAALATCVFFAVPLYGVWERGLSGYLKLYIEPSVFMLPFTIVGELTRTLALAVRLFGNIMSGEMLVAMLLAIVPLFFPIVMQILGLLIGLIQAYIFAVLATVYIASATSNSAGQSTQASLQERH